ncbi:2-dehydropantoate 2-reductase [Azospirillum picis]|uniref:2-dehydropantoate 2-reductase n=1 Tax=Azospirillum picis TaxID=488438 RepID=A0ABU0MHM5_9PROT|nr:2-dehydropantoate 2-reductase [Azospirillum picis]MBP2298845.1 2-dehydropantoate 2-reductase [Azospirillum picis]MDQ0532913.1 2-dehydropantoate 2-reductase [Azospirillum picis]
MKICIYGSGAIGGYLGVRLHQAGAEVSLVARGAHLAAMRENGVTLLMGEERTVVRPRCTDNPADLGPQDYVVVALKAHSVPGVVPAMQPLLGDHTAVVTAVNGIPYWYFYGTGGAFDGRILETVDPDGAQWHGLGPQRAIGCVVYPATEVVEPGVIQHVYGDKFSLGEPDGSRSERVTALSQAMEAGGLRAPVLDRIRDEIWLKLWGNLCFNPISALTHGTLEVICGDTETRAVAKAMMLEAKEIGDRLGVHFRVDVERRINGAAAVGAHKTSMLQDLERGRPMEIDALLSVVQEMGRMVEVATPTIDVVLALVKQRGETAGCYSRPVPAAPAVPEVVAAQ